MKKLLLIILLFTGTLSAQTYQPTWDSIDKRPTPAWFTEAKFGIFIHWGTYSVPAYAPVIPEKLAYAEWYWNNLTRWPRRAHVRPHPDGHLGVSPEGLWRGLSLPGFRAAVSGRIVRPGPLG